MSQNLFHLVEDHIKPMRQRPLQLQPRPSFEGAGDWPAGRSETVGGDGKTVHAEDEG